MISKQLFLKFDIEHPMDSQDLLFPGEKPNVIDLFCGCGGLSLGFINAGYNILFGVDTDVASRETFQENHKEALAYDWDLSDDKFLQKIEEAAGGEPIHVVVGGPPCQGFSLTGPRKLDDPRNTLYWAILKSVKKIKPLAFVIENVKGLASLYNGSIKDDILRRFQEAGFNVSYKILCAADYGVPQTRERLFLVGIRRALGVFAFPNPTHLPTNYVTCEDAISDLPSRESELGSETDHYTIPPITEYQKLMRKNCVLLHNHVATNHTEYVKEVISMVPEGGNYKNLPKGVGESRRFNEAWTRYHSKKPSRTIDTGHRNHFHYKFNRVPTIRENARLQSFPDEFVFKGSKTQQNKQVGNAVPPLLAEQIARQLFGYIVRKDTR